MHASVAQSCPTLCDPMDCSPLAFSVHGIFPARILECIAMPFSRGSCQPRHRTHISYVSCIGNRVLYHQSHLNLVSLFKKSLFLWKRRVIILAVIFPLASLLSQNIFFQRGCFINTHRYFFSLSLGILLWYTKKGFIS